MWAPEPRGGRDQDAGRQQLESRAAVHTLVDTDRTALTEFAVKLCPGVKTDFKDTDSDLPIFKNRIISPL